MASRAVQWTAGTNAAAYRLAAAKREPPTAE
eukprot:CAMPEP_0206262386 /NCGR_PEP_ID=MMETSP0047_2-20121206/28206_1 /ASSEMBLY_ACC=CAM_ASM_000192 /TAXON_ID=195065 /ORGANISM="Chroomonas mesostigmatica_cf, Strain CCMP1168" /LENGTH=30 /DNA_ID= /DNA_START= /DNA_END= /DNA_ORIENTATION=